MDESVYVNVVTELEGSTPPIPKHATELSSGSSAHIGSPQPFPLRSALMLSSHLLLCHQSGRLPRDFPTKILSTCVCSFKVTYFTSSFSGNKLQFQLWYQNVIADRKKHS